MRVHLYQSIEEDYGDAVLILSPKAHESLQLALSSHPLDKKIKTLFKECKVHRARSSDCVLYEWYDTNWKGEYSLFLSQVFSTLRPDEFRLAIAKVTELRLGTMEEGFNYNVASRVLFEENESTNKNKETELCLQMN